MALHILDSRGVSRWGCKEHIRRTPYLFYATMDVDAFQYCFSVSSMLGFFFTDLKVNIIEAKIVCDLYTAGNSDVNDFGN